MVDKKGGWTVPAVRIAAVVGIRAALRRGMRDSRRYNAVCVGGILSAGCKVRREGGGAMHDRVLIPPPQDRMSVGTGER